MYVDQSFFQLDIGMSPEVYSFLPGHLQHRFLINFRAVGNVSWKTLELIRNWMKQRWSEVPEDGTEAFFNKFLTHIKTQKVSLGETSPAITFKVHFFILFILLFNQKGVFRKL